MKKIRIVITEDYTIVREGLCSLLTTYPEFQVVGDTGDGFTLLELAEKLSPDLILMGIALPKLWGWPCRATVQWLQRIGIVSG